MVQIQPPGPLTKMGPDCEALREVRRRLERHPGDAPWSCIECYHSRPCTERVILEAAEHELERVLGLAPGGRV